MLIKYPLNKNEENILVIIRELYTQHKKRIPIHWIYNKTSREGIPNKTVKIVLKSLTEKKMLTREDTFWKPIFDEKQEQSIKQDGISFNLLKITKCLKNINKPSKPNEILMKFIEIYGMPDNVESFLRYMRTLGENPTSSITRDSENKYWLKNKYCNRNTTLLQFKGRNARCGIN